MLLAFSSVKAEKLFTFKSHSNIEDCNDPFFKSCSEVNKKLKNDLKLKRINHFYKNKKDLGTLVFTNTNIEIDFGSPASCNTNARSHLFSVFKMFSLGTGFEPTTCKT